MHGAVVSMSSCRRLGRARPSSTRLMTMTPSFISSPSCCRVRPASVLSRRTSSPRCRGFSPGSLGGSAAGRGQRALAQAAKVWPIKMYLRKVESASGLPVFGLVLAFSSPPSSTSRYGVMAVTRSSMAGCRSAWRAAPSTCKFSGASASDFSCR